MRTIKGFVAGQPGHVFSGEQVDGWAAILEPEGENSVVDFPTGLPGNNVSRLQP